MQKTCKNLHKLAKIYRKGKDVQQQQNMQKNDQKTKTTKNGQKLAKTGENRQDKAKIFKKGKDGQQQRKKQKIYQQT